MLDGKGQQRDWQSEETAVLMLSSFAALLGTLAVVGEPEKSSVSQEFSAPGLGV